VGRISVGDPVRITAAPTLSGRASDTGAVGGL
jgi:hypothetical protein